MNENKGSF